MEALPTRVEEWQPKGLSSAQVGAASGPALCFVLPFACHLRLFPGEHTRARRAASPRGP